MNKNGLPVYHISIHALLAESDTQSQIDARVIPISIHALLAESDSRKAAIGNPTLISIHALLAESDQQKSGDGKAYVNFYPRSPCGERQQKCTKQWGTFCAYETNFIGIASSC